MLRRRLISTTWLAVGCTYSVFLLFALSAARTVAQDAQAEAKARVTRENAAQDAVPLTEPTVPPNAKAEDEKGGPNTNPEGLKRRAGERVGLGPRGRALVLGMHLQEIGTGRVNVVEVSAASPAFDAGIKQGDEIVSFSGFRGDTYRKWIEGISRLTTDAEDNSRLPVVLMRRGEQVDAQIRIPESNVGPIKLPIGPGPQAQASESVAIGIQGAPAPGAGGNIAINNAGPFGNFFGGESSPASEKAMAEIFRVGGPITAAQATPTPPGRPQPASNARIGMAGFRDSSNGMLVMVDVGALPPGNYLVAINDPSLVGGQPAPGAVPNNPTPPGIPAPATPSLPPGAGPATNPAPNVLPKPSADGTPPQSSVRPAGQDAIPPTILAQVADPSQPASGASGTTIPPTGQVRPSTVPPTGQVNPSNTTPTGQSTVNNALLEQARQAREAAAAAAAGNKAPNQIGTLTVDQSGTGRMQTTVEAMRVQDVVGQAIVLYSRAVAAPNTLPPNLDPSADPAGGSAVIDPARPTERRTAPPTTKALPTPGATQGGLNPQPVAAGIIRLMSDRRPAPPPAVDAENVFADPLQPAANTPPVGTNPIR